MVNQEFVKKDCFNGTNFIRKKDKIMFLLTVLKISYILDLNLPEILASIPEDNDWLKAKHKKTK